MNTQSFPVVSADSYLTLHYRLSAKDGEVIVSTFSDSPATLQMGNGQLAPELEKALIGLVEGSHRIQELAPEQAFGVRNPDLVQRVTAVTLRENSATDEQYAIGDLVDFAAPSGGRFAGILRAIDEQGYVFDFNHPLAGQTIIFETKIIGIL